MLRGAYVNTAEEKCSIHESGRMVFECIKDSPNYSLDYFTIDAIDIGALVSEGRVRSRGSKEDAGEIGYDFWVFNWHFCTMAIHIDLESIGRVPGTKFAILLEVEPGNPLRHVAVDVFDGYIALDPSIPVMGKIFPFPRPLPGEGRRPVGRNAVPVISSFGFGTPGKGFAFLVEAVNREFDQAIVRVNIPPGDYTQSFDGIHGTDYPRYLASLCQRIAKPGISIQFTYDFMTPEELLDWCMESDLNCFLYTRRQSGLSATTDQSILSGRPLLTGTNDTFRHIHKYIPPYPVMSLRQALESSTPSVHRLQQDWSYSSFTRTFERMLVSAGVIELAQAAQEEPSLRPVQRIPLLLLSLERRATPDFLCYETRLADALGRSGLYDVHLVRGRDLDGFVKQSLSYKPAAVIVTGFHGKIGALAKALACIDGPKILLRDQELLNRQAESLEDGISILPRQPIIPYFTVCVAKRSPPASIWLIGFGNPASNLEEVLEKIIWDTGEAKVFIEAPESDKAKIEERISKSGMDYAARNLTVSVQSLPMEAEALVNLIAGDSLIVFYHDENRAEELEGILGFAMTTERAVAFTRSSLFPRLLGAGTYIEDMPVPDLIAMGMAAQIKLYADYGEWQAFAAIDRILSRKLKMWAAMGILEGLPSLEGEVFVDAAYRAVLGRMPDADGLARHAAWLRNGRSKAELVGSLLLSAEGLACQKGVHGPVAGFDDLSVLEGGLFVEGAYRIILGRAPDPDGLVGHLALLNGGMTKAELAGNMFLSPEAQARQTRVEEISSTDGTAMLQDESFIQWGYRTLLGYAPDPAGLAYHATLLREGTPRNELAGHFFLSPEGRVRQAALHGPVDDPETLAGLAGETFVDRAFRSILGRTPDREELTHHVASLNGGMSRTALIGSLLLSPEGVARQNSGHGPFPGADELPVLLQSIAPPAPVSESGRLATPMSVVLSRSEEGRNLFILLEASDSPSIVLSDFAFGLGRHLLAQGEVVRFVRWSPRLKKFVLLARGELAGLAQLPNGQRHLDAHPVDRSVPVILDERFAANCDWLIVPGTVRVTPSIPYLFETEIILEARRLRLGTAFLFRDAEPLRRPSCAGEEAAAFELYMQALLLADLVVPVSTIAENDLIGFFTQHQRADRVPLIRRIPFLAAEGPSPEGVRRLRGLLGSALDTSRHLTSLYCCLDLKASGRADRQFSQRVAHAFAARGVEVIPAVWDNGAGRLRPAATAELAKLGFGGGTDIWSEWIDPKGAEAPDWVLVPGRLSGTALEDLAAFAKAEGLRTAALLTENGPGAKPLFEQLTGFDKVFCGSTGIFDDFFRFLLSWRGRLNCAEDRFKLLAAPNEIPERLRLGAPKRPVRGPFRIHAVIEPAHSAGVTPLATAVMDVVQQFPGGVELSVSGPAPDGALTDRLNRQPGFVLRFDTETEGTVSGRCREDADLVISLGDDGVRAPAVADSLWQGIPCLVLGDSGQEGDYRPGLMHVDIKDPAALREAILMCREPHWRDCLAREALSVPVRTWNAYVRDIAGELVSDRLVDLTRAPERRVLRDIYATLPNLKRRPKLSICISTYKRAGWVALNLRNIFSQLGSPRSDLEILVVDNTSPDNTPEVVKPYLDRPDFTYIRNPKNVGLVGNLAVTAQRARGEYILILGDDDLTRAGTIDRIFHVLDQHPDISLIYLNYGYSSESNPGSITDLQGFLDGYNVLEPPCPDEVAPVKRLAAKCENFFTAIYSHVYRRDHALRSYCQDTSGRIFATMVSCVPSAYYVLHYMPNEMAYWIGEPALVVNSNVSWAAYGAMLELEHLPRCWDLAERAGCDVTEVDRRRSNRLWLVEMMWRELFENDQAGNSAYLSPARLLIRLKHLPELERYLPELRAIYDRAHRENHPAALLPTEELFSAFAG